MLENGAVVTTYWHIHNTHRMRSVRDVCDEFDEKHKKTIIGFKLNDGNLFAGQFYAVFLTEAVGKSCKLTSCVS